MQVDPTKLAKAWRFAAAHHETPYLRHLGLVAMELGVALELEPAADAELSMLCAILHDVLEDTHASREQLAAEFGEAVAAGVAALSKRKATDPMGDSLARIREQPQAVWKVKLADRTANLYPPPRHWSRDKCARYLDEAHRILDALGEASPVLAERFREQMDRYPDFWPA